MRAVAAAAVLCAAVWSGACAHRPTPAPATAPPPSALRVRVTLARDASPGGASGRLIVLMAPGTDAGALRRPPFLPGGPMMAAVDVPWLAAGATVELPVDAAAFPAPLAAAARGSYVLRAVLDRDRDYAYAMGARAGDLVSAPATLRDATPAEAGTIELTLGEVLPATVPADTDDVKWVEVPSALLQAFWGRPVMLRAAVVLPRGYADEPARRWPTAYEIHGFGGSPRLMFAGGARARERLLRERPAMVLVALDASCGLGHHAFVDSVNNGPWGRALVEELIPALESRFRLDPRPAARFLTGHSSGGWSSLWIQVSHPDDFGGTWSTAPDPVDFRDFTGIDATPGSRDNAYRAADGRPRPLVRMQGREVFSFEAWARAEGVMGEVGGQLASFEAAFSPRGADGRPMRLFDRATGALDPVVLEAWTRFDVRRVLERDWATLGPKLAGKLHVITGGDDTFHLDGATRLLCDFLASHHADATCDIVPGRNHFDLHAPDAQRWPRGLAGRIFDEMLARYAREGKR